MKLFLEVNNSVKFMWNGIKVDGVLYPAIYSAPVNSQRPNEIQDGGTITIYARGYKSFPKIEGLNIENNSDSMTDYFESDKIRVSPDNIYFNDVKRAYELCREHAGKITKRKFSEDITLEDIQNKKYELIFDNDEEYIFNSTIQTTKSISWLNHKLYRIRALKDFSDVKAGDLGGFVQSEKNLSQTGNCWIYDNARVYDDAYVYNHAKIMDVAWVYGNAEVYDQATVINTARVYGNARIYGKAEISGECSIYENAQIWDNVEVSAYAQVHGNAKVFGNAYIFDYANIDGDLEIDYNVDIGSERLEGEYFDDNSAFGEDITLEDKIRITLEDMDETGTEPVKGYNWKDDTYDGVRIIRKNKTHDVNGNPVYKIFLADGTTKIVRDG